MDICPHNYIHIYPHISTHAKSQGATVKLRGDSVTISSTTYTYETLHKVPEKYSLAAARTVRVNPETIAFYSKYSFLSNFFPAKLDIDGDIFSSVEQYFQRKKLEAAGRDDLITTVMTEHDCVKLKRLGDSVKLPAGSSWDKDKLKVMQTALHAKFSQNNDLQSKLKSTANMKLTEATRDIYWETGAILSSPEMKNTTWKGQNRLGQLLMELRSNI